jgi:hypothetical protein
MKVRPPFFMGSQRAIPRLELARLWQCRTAIVEDRERGGGHRIAAPGKKIDLVADRIPMLVVSLHVRLFMR